MLFHPEVDRCVVFLHDRRHLLRQGFHLCDLGQRLVLKLIIDGVESAKTGVNGLRILFCFSDLVGGFALIIRLRQQLLRVLA